MRALPRLARGLLALLLGSVSGGAWGVAATAQDAITSPEQALGHPVGADHFLASYSQLTEYWRQLARQSDRMVLEDIGTTSYGQRMLMAVISSPANLARLEHCRQVAERLCRARDLTGEQAAALAADGRAVVWIDGGLHATESVAGQSVLELVYRMLARDDAWTRRVLDQVILLVCPANPDGMEMVARGYMATQKVGHLPVLYQRYAGHDNNRDFYMASLPETEAIDRVLYRRWYPQIVYDHHQSAPRGTVLFTPPFRDPFNYHIDPLVVRGIELAAAHVNAAFGWRGMAGVISRSGGSYSTWWNGGLRTTCYFHNMIGLLSEVFGSPNPSRLRQTLGRRLPSSDYPMPIASQAWHARQTIEYLQTANEAVLDLAASYREQLLLGIYRMGRNAIRRGSGDHWTPTPRLLGEARRRDRLRNPDAAVDGREDDVEPATLSAFEDPGLRDARCYVLPADQRDFAAAVRFTNALVKNGVEVRRAVASFTAAGRRCPAGSLLVFTAQAFRAHVLDMFEPQWYPQDLGRNGAPVRPYDSAGYTPAIQMGVEFERVQEPLEGGGEPLEGFARVPAGHVRPGSAGYLLGLGDSNATVAINRLLAAGESLQRLTGELRTAAGTWPPGTVLIERGDATERRVGDLARELGIDFEGLDAVPEVPRRPMREPRVGLYEVYGGDPATGWTRWVLERFEFPVETLDSARVARGHLRDDYDVLLFHNGLPRGSHGGSGAAALSDGERAAMVAALPPFEDWSKVAACGGRLTDGHIDELRTFAEDGGTLLAFGHEVERLIDQLGLPVESGVVTAGEDGTLRPARSTEFYVPTSLLRVEIERSSDLAFGMPAELGMVLRRGPVLGAREGADGVEVVARYATAGVLMSGWAIGAELLAGRGAVVSVRLGRGRVVLYGADVVYRGQAQASFPLLFNAIFAAPARMP